MKKTVVILNSKKLHYSDGKVIVIIHFSFPYSNNIYIVDDGYPPDDDDEE